MSVKHYIKSYVSDLSLIASSVCLILAIAASIATNLAAVEQIKVNQYGLYALYSLAFLVSLAPLPLGMALNTSKLYILPLILVIIIDSSITIIGGMYELENQSASTAYQQTILAQIKNAEEKRDWCKKMPSTVCKLSELDADLKVLYTDAQKIDKKMRIGSNPLFIWVMMILTGLRAFGVPIISAFLGHFISTLEIFRVSRDLTREQNTEQNAPNIVPEPVLRNVSSVSGEQRREPIIKTGSEEERRIEQAYLSVVRRGDKPTVRSVAREARVANTKVPANLLEHFNRVYRCHAANQ